MLVVRIYAATKSKMEKAAVANGAVFSQVRTLVPGLCVYVRLI